VQTTECDALVQSVLANPTDDLPRLVLADWLDEHGQPERAEFIRVQCELTREYPQHAKRPDLAAEEWHRGDAEAAGDCSGCRLLAREKELWSRMRSIDLSGLGPIAGPLWATALGVLHNPWALAPLAVVRRGFVDEVFVPIRVFVAQAGRLFAAHPVRAVRLTDVRPERVEGFELTRDSGWTYFVGDANAGQTPYHLPNALWRHLPRSWYRTENEAVAALEDACVAYGRVAARSPTASTARSRSISASIGR
jgi:uncharacterized protein (TIGR02996 family)